MGLIAERSPSLSSKTEIPHFPFGFRTNVDALRFTIPGPLQELPTQNQWLTEYEERKDSIFRYYNLDNEVKFIQEANLSSLEQQTYYLNENVKRFLGEFVGKVPYTTIPYELDAKGFSYAGMYVMDSYKKAAKLSNNPREKAEAVGFQIIQDKLSSMTHENPTIAYWISPPKIADYGFIFVLAKEKSGHVKEYILRYDEKIGDLTTSNHLLTGIDSSMNELAHPDDFLLVPLFGRKEDGTPVDIDVVMRMLHIDEEKIARSHHFENQVDALLSPWINEYSRRVIALSNVDITSELYRQEVEQTKILLMSIYHQAEQIIKLPQPISFHQKSIYEVAANPFSYDLLAGYASVFQQGNEPTAQGGSCPAINSTSSNSIEMHNAPPSNYDLLNTLTKGIVPESLLKNKERYDDYKCPKCNTKIKGELVGKPETWETNCPHCNGQLHCAKT